MLEHLALLHVDLDSQHSRPVADSKPIADTLALTRPFLPTITELAVFQVTVPAELVAARLGLVKHAGLVVVQLAELVEFVGLQVTGLTGLVGLVAVQLAELVKLIKLEAALLAKPTAAGVTAATGRADSNSSG